MRKRKNFVQANKKVHKVELQWHYPVMIKYGYVAQDKEKIGFVRSYKYIHPETGDEVICATGCNADYWTSGRDQGYYQSLEEHLKEK